jgi:hypothetical protein
MMARAAENEAGGAGAQLDDGGVVQGREGEVATRWRVTREALLADCLRLPASQQAWLTRLGTLGVCDDTFLVALVLVPRLAFDGDMLVRAERIGDRSGLRLVVVKRALCELVRVGALEIGRTHRCTRRLAFYRRRRSCQRGRTSREAGAVA